MEEFVQEEEHFLEEALPIAPGERAFVADEVAPFVGMLITNLMYAAPLERVIAARAERSLGETNPLPWIFIVANCVAWLGYSYATLDHWVFMSNFPGAALGLFFCMTAIAHGSPAQRRAVDRALVALAAVVASAGWAAAHARARETFGVLATGALVLMNAAPLSTARSVLRERSAASIDARFAAGSAASSFFFVVYGVGIGDAFLWAPNAAGLAMNAAQLALVCAFRPGARERHGHGLSHGHGGAGGALKRLGSEIAPEAASLEHVT